MQKTILHRSTHTVPKFCTHCRKRTSVHTLPNFSCRICSEDTMPDESERIRGVILGNSYSERLIGAHTKQSRLKIARCIVEKKHLLLALPFRGVAAEVCVCGNLRESLQRGPIKSCLIEQVAIFSSIQRQIARSTPISCNLLLCLAL